MELYGAHQCQARVFCPPEAVRPIGEAAEKVLYDLFKLEFLPEARAYEHV